MALPKTEKPEVQTKANKKGGKHAKGKTAKGTTTETTKGD